MTMKSSSGETIGLIGFLLAWWLSAVSIANGFVTPTFHTAARTTRPRSTAAAAVAHLNASQGIDGVDLPAREEKGGEDEWTILLEERNGGSAGAAAAVVVRKQIIEDGHDGGPVLGPGSTVEVECVGTVMHDDRDASEDFEPGATEFVSGGRGLYKFTLGRNNPNRAIALAVASMKPGERARVVCPAHYAYGSEGIATTSKNGNTVVVPPSATLCFDIKLVRVWVTIQGG